MLTQPNLQRAFPPAIRAIFVLCLLLFIVLRALPVESSSSLIDLLALDTQDIFSPKIWRFITYGFVHYSFQHLFWNLFALVMFGATVEHILGTRSCGTVFLLSTLGGALGQAFWSHLIQPGNALVLGASGGIAGLIGAFTLLAPKDTTVYLGFILPIKLRYFGVIYIALQLLFAVTDQGGTAYGAHIFGFLSGYLVVSKSYHNLGEQLYQKIRSKPRKSHLRVVPQPSQPRREQPKQPDRKAQAQEKIDRLLDKITRSGLESLTPSERSELEKYSRIIKEDTP